MVLQRYRNIIAYFMSVWFMMLVISGAIFTHKEITSTGEIIVHNHPYDFTEKGKKHQHKSDDEIHFLDVVFCQIYTPTDLVTFEPIIRTIIDREYHVAYLSCFFDSEAKINYLRGPPSYC